MRRRTRSSQRASTRSLALRGYVLRRLRRAFANLRRAASDDAELRFIAWRSAAENPFMTRPESAPQRRSSRTSRAAADGPWQFAFADRDRVQSVLEESGWAAASTSSRRRDLHLPGERARPLPDPARPPRTGPSRSTTRRGPRSSRPFRAAFERTSAERRSATRGLLGGSPARAWPRRGEGLRARWLDLVSVVISRLAKRSSGCVDRPHVGVVPMKPLGADDLA